MEYTYTFKEIDRETAKSFEELVKLLSGQLEATVKVDNPSDERMTSMVSVTIKNQTIKKHEYLAVIAEVMHAKLMEVKAEVEATENPG